MPTMTYNPNRAIFCEPKNLPEVEYSEEDVARFKRIADITKAKRATGEHQLQSLSEFAAKYGIKM